MNIKDLLNSHYEISCAIDSKCMLVIKVNGLTKKVTTTRKADELIAKINKLEEEINAEIDKLLTVTRKIQKLIACVENSKGRTVLERKYLLHESYEAIGNKMGYSTRHIVRIHDKALEELKEKAV